MYIYENIEWATTPIIVTSNNERININAQLSLKFAKIHQHHRLIWTLLLDESAIASLSDEGIQDIYDSNLASTDFFVKDDPGLITYNLSPPIGLVNNTTVKYYAITLHSNKNKEDILLKTTENTHNVDIHLRYPHIYHIYNLFG